MFYFGAHGFHFPLPWLERSFICVIKWNICFIISECSCYFLWNDIWYSFCLFMHATYIRVSCLWNIHPQKSCFLETVLDQKILVLVQDVAFRVSIWMGDLASMNLDLLFFLRRIPVVKELSLLRKYPRRCLRPRSFPAISITDVSLTVNMFFFNRSVWKCIGTHWFCDINTYFACYESILLLLVVAGCCLYQTSLILKQ